MRRATSGFLPRRLGRLVLADLSKWALSAGIVLVLAAPAFGIDEGQIAWGPEGTIGRGSQSATHRGLGRPLDPISGRQSAPDLRGINFYHIYPTSTYSRGYSSAPMRYSTIGASRPYLTNRFYEPGDGYRYPVYYNPANGTYFYYPVRR